MSNLPTNNLELWLDASSINSLQIDNGSLIGISDKSGKTGQWTISNGSLINNAINSLSSIRFVGSGNAIVAPNSINTGSFSFMHSTETHIFGVMKTPLPGTSSIIAANALLLTTYNNKEIGPGYRLFFGSSARYKASITAHINKGVEGAYVVGLTALNQALPDNWHIFHVVTKPNLSQISARGSITIGNASYSNNTFSESPTTSNSQSRLRLVSVADGAGAIAGELGELLIYSGSLTESDIYTIKDILSNKWGISEQIIPLTPTPTVTVSRTPGPTATPTATPTPSVSPDGITYINNSSSNFTKTGITDFTLDTTNMRLFYSTSSGEVITLSAKSYKNIQYRKINTRSVDSCSYNPNTNRLVVGAQGATVSLENNLLLLNPDNLETIRTVPLGTASVYKLKASKLVTSLNLNKTYAYLLGSSSSAIQKLIAYDWDTNTSVNVLTSLYDIYDMQLDEDNSTLYVSAKVSSNTNRIYKINTNTDTVLQTWDFYARFFRIVGDKIVYTDNTTLYIRDIATQSIIYAYQFHKIVNRFTQRGPYCMTYNSVDNTLYVFDAYAPNNTPVLYVFNMQNNSYVGSFPFGGALSAFGVDFATYDSNLKKIIAMKKSRYLYNICSENIIKNNSFNRQTLTGSCSSNIGTITKSINYGSPWTVSNSANLISMSICNNLDPYNPFASLGPASGSGFIEQTFSTVSGYDYLIEFAMGNAPGFNTLTDRMARVSLIDNTNNETLYNQLFNIKSINTGVTYNSLGWQTKTLSFTANSNATTIKFSSPASGVSQGGAAIDNVIITRMRYDAPFPTPTPSPTSPGDNLTYLQQNFTFNIGTTRVGTTATVHGKSLPAFYGAVSSDDENVVLVPFSSNNIGLYNRDSDTYTDGPAHGKGPSAFFGGVLYANKVIMIPYGANTIGIYDIGNNIYLDGPSASQYAGGVLSHNGLVIMAPHTNTKIGIYNPATNSFTLGPAHNQGNDGVFAGAVALPNNKILLVPNNADNIGIYDPGNNTYTNGPAHGAGDGAYLGGVVIPSTNKVILIPYNSTNIGIYDINTGNFTTGPAHNRGSAAFAGGVLLPNNNVLLVPYNSVYSGVYNSSTGTYNNGPSISGSGSARFVGGLLVGGDKVVLCPAMSPQIRSITFNSPANINMSVLRSRFINKL